MKDQPGNSSLSPDLLKADGGKTKSNAIEIPSIILPKGGGAIKGIDEKFSVNAVNGTASFSIPLSCAASRGVSPSLSISYNSGAGNGVFGLGWNLSSASIKRKTDKTLPLYNDGSESDSFLFADAEDLVPEFKKENDGSFSKDLNGDYIIKKRNSADGSFTISYYKPRIEGSFARIERWEDKVSGASKWRVISKDNTTTLFGWSVHSVIADPNDPLKIFEWLPEFVFDDKGNCSQYIYQKEDSTGFNIGLSHNNNRFKNGQITYTNLYLQKVVYGNIIPYSKFEDPFPAESGYLFSIIFDYGILPNNVSPATVNTWEYRPDAFSEYKAGFEIRTTRLCHRVLFFHHFKAAGEYDGLVKSVNFDYDIASLQGITFLRSVSIFGYLKKDDGSYTSKHLPPTEFEYQRPDWNKDIKSISTEHLVHSPAGLDEPRYQFTDLFNEGLSGILTEQAGGWYYKHNLGGGKFERAKLVSPKPSFTGLGGQLQLADLDADGGKQLVSFYSEPKGYFELNDDNGWQPFQSFPELPNIDLNNDNCRMLDLNGDGKAELLITEDNVFCWYESNGRRGVSQLHKTTHPFDEEAGPHIVFADSKQTIFIADMTGDGMPDIARIRNGDICYWPNLGYGRFGSKTAMDNAPLFDHPGSFNPNYIKLADIDGSGTADIIYTGKNKFSCWMNLSGNSFSSTPFEIEAFPEINNNANITVTDLLGNGVACIVWSGNLAKDAGASLKYIDLMNGKKPHLMVFYKNNMGKEVSLNYAPSTKFYIEDKLAGRPWITKLHFPVHCIAASETLDKISGWRFTSNYKYHHGYYDHAEREFRGFGMVEQTDTEQVEHWTGGLASNLVDIPVQQKPMVSKTWFHTGAFPDNEKILTQFAHEYWYKEMDREGFPVVHHEVGLPEADIIAASGIPIGSIEPLTMDERREAMRACKSMPLRSEVFAHDAPAVGASPSQMVKQLTPYSVSTHNCVIELLQPKGKNRHAIFIVKESEALTYSYERNSEDPRIAHNLNLKLDEYGNILESAAIVYPRLLPDLNLPPDTQQEQNKTLIIYTKQSFTKDVTGNNVYRLRLPAEVKTYELKGVTKPGSIYKLSDLDNILDDSRSTGAEYHEINKPLQVGKAQRRLIENLRSIYYKNDLSGPLALNDLESLALPFENYQLAYTPALLSDIFSPKATDVELADLVLQGKFSHALNELGNQDTNWWVRSGNTHFIQGGETVIHARNRFYMPVSYTDPYGSTTSLTYYSNYFLLIQQIEDELKNRSRVDKFNFHTLSPERMKDINNNLSGSLADELGFVKATAVLGKGNEADEVAGLTSYTSTIEQNAIDAFFATAISTDLITRGKALLQHASTRFLYDLDEYRNTGKPAVVVSITREEHFQKNNASPIQLSFEYSNGLGKTIMKKVQAEPGLAKKVTIDPGGNTYSVTIEDTSLPDPKQLRWIGSGRTILNNKGNPVKQYEPYFSTTHHYEDQKELVETGVTPLMYYDPVGRLVRTNLPDGTFTRVEFDSWKQIVYDANDNMLDPECSWYLNRTNLLINAALLAAGKSPSLEKIAADKAARHANTPNILHLDTLGRPLLSVEHNKNMATDADEFYRTKLERDIEGNLRSVTDARELAENGTKGNIVMQYKYDMLGSMVYSKSMDAGQRWMLNTILGNPFRTWDERGHEFRFSYDALHRPLSTIVIGGDGIVPLNNIFQRVMYGETLLLPGRTNEAALQAINVLGKRIQLFDTAGLVDTPAFDFKGQPVSTNRKLFRKYKEVANWTDPNLVIDLETDSFIFITETDALGRITSQQAPDGSIITPSYNETGLLKGESVTQTAPALAAPYIKDIQYNEKGQRSKIIYGNDVSTNFYYDKETFRLNRIESKRKNNEVVQDLFHTYDGTGNITAIEDKALPISFFSNAIIQPLSEYTYDALYRLAEAKGRENNAAINFGDCDNWNDKTFKSQLSQGDPMAVRNYTETYQYDPAGNILQMKHVAAGGNWTRGYDYEKLNNRLLSTHVGDNGAPANYNQYTYHARHGFMTRLPHLETIGWNFKEEVSLSSRQHCTDDNVPVITYYQYDGRGQRIRKITENAAPAGGFASKKEERIYIAGYELYKKYTGADAGLQRVSLSLIDQGHRFVIIETRNDVDDGTDKRVARYQLYNHTGSASIELDGTAHAQLISYEEYHPFGTTAYKAVNDVIKTAAKRYSYTGMERDEETGLAYHGARYYMPWLGRWCSTDPIGIGDGVNLYRYCNNSPTMYQDKSGKQADETPRLGSSGPSLLHPVSMEDRVVASMSPGTYNLIPSLSAAGIFSLPPGILPPLSTSTPHPAPAAAATPDTTGPPAVITDPRPSPVTASFTLFSPRLEVRFWQRAQLTADTSAVSLSTINTGDVRIRAQYEYGGDLSLRLGDPDRGSGSFGYNPSTGVGTFNVSGGSGDSATGFRQSFTVTTAGDASLQYGIGVRSPLGENGVLRIEPSVGYNAATRAFRLSIGVGGEMLPTAADLGTSVPLAESRARDVIGDAGSIAPNVDAIRGFVGRHTTERTVDPANPGGATATDFGALGAAGSQLGRVAAAPRTAGVRGALDFSVAPTASGATDVRIMLRAQLYNF